MAPKAVLASEKILRRIHNVEDQLDRANRGGVESEIVCLSKVRQAYIVDLMDILNEEEHDKPKAERVSFNLQSTEDWIKKHSNSSIPQ